jgi:hypothetical protein
MTWEITGWKDTIEQYGEAGLRTMRLQCYNRKRMRPNVQRSC